MAPGGFAVYPRSTLQVRANPAAGPDRRQSAEGLFGEHGYTGRIGSGDALDGKLLLIASASPFPSCGMASGPYAEGEVGVGVIVGFLGHYSSDCFDFLSHFVVEVGAVLELPPAAPLHSQSRVCRQKSRRKRELDSGCWSRLYRLCVQCIGSQYLCIVVRSRFRQKLNISAIILMQGKAKIHNGPQYATEHRLDVLRSFMSNNNAAYWLNFSVELQFTCQTIECSKSPPYQEVTARETRGERGE